MRVLHETPAPSDEQANQVGAFRGQLAALRAPSQWTRTPAGAQLRKRRRIRRRKTREAADAAKTAASCEDAASRLKTNK